MADHYRIYLSKDELQKFSESMEENVELIGRTGYAAVGSLAGYGRHQMAEKEAKLFHGFSRKWSKEGHENRSWFNPKQGYMYNGRNQFGDTGGTPMIMYSWEKAKYARFGKRSVAVVRSAYVTSQMANLYEKPVSGKRSPVLYLNGDRWGRAVNDRPGRSFFYSSGMGALEAAKPRAYAEAIRRWNEWQAGLRSRGL